MRIECLRKLMVWLIIFTFCFGGAAPALSGSRVLPAGKVKVYQGQKLVQILKQESVFPNGALLITEGRCGVRMESLYLLAEDGSAFGVEEAFSRKDLRVDKGVVYFVITRNVGRLAFFTPAGILSAVQIRLDAAGNGDILKGYLDVSADQVQLGVLEGGTMVLSTPYGEKVVRSGKQITLAFVDLMTDEDKKTIKEKKKGADENEKALEKKKKRIEPENDADKDIPATYFIGGGALAAAALAGLAGAGGSSPSPGPGVAPVSPSSPTP